VVPAERSHDLQHVVAAQYPIAVHAVRQRPVTIGQHPTVQPVLVAIGQCIGPRLNGQHHAIIGVVGRNPHRCVSSARKSPSTTMASRRVNARASASSSASSSARPRRAPDSPLAASTARLWAAVRSIAQPCRFASATAWSWRVLVFIAGAFRVAAWVGLGRPIPRQ